MWLAMASDLRYTKEVIRTAVKPHIFHKKLKCVRLGFKCAPVLVAALLELEHVNVEGGVEGDVGHELHGLLLGGVAPGQAAVTAPPALITVPYQEEAGEGKGY